MAKCTSCLKQTPIVECKDCSRKLCYQCDDRVHSNLLMSRHNRVTIPFREFQRTSLKTLRTDIDDSYTEHIFVSPKSHSLVQSSIIQSIRASPQYDSQKYSSIIDRRQERRYEPLLYQSFQHQKTEPSVIIDTNDVKQQIDEEDKLFQKKKIALMQQILKVREEKASPEDQDQIDQMVALLQDVKDKYQNGESVIQAKVQEVESLRDQYNEQLIDHKSQLTEVREKYESQVLSLEDKLVKASERIDELVNQEDDEEMDEDEEQEESEIPMDQEIIKLQSTTKKIVDQAGHRTEEVITQVKKCDDLIHKVKQTTQLQTSQLTKMDEIIQMFKVYSDEMAKEKQLLLLDNEKLISEVEIFGRFFEDNAELMEKIGHAPLEQE